MLRGTMRLGRGLYVTGGGGFVAFVFGLAIMRGMFMLVLACVVVGLTSAVTLALTAHERSRTNRRRLACKALRMSVTVESARHDSTDPPVIGLYALGSEFLTGIHPPKYADLQRLYRDRAIDLLPVAMFPDRTTASAAKRALVRNRFSAGELKALFLPADAPRLDTPADQPISETERPAMSTMKFTEAFAFYGATLANPMWAYSAIADDGALVLSCWSHKLKLSDGALVYTDHLSRWSDRSPGKKVLAEHLAAALKQSLPVHLVVTTTDRPDVVDSGADASKIKKTFHVRPDLVGRVSSFDGDNFIVEFRRA